MLAKRRAAQRKGAASEASRKGDVVHVARSEDSVPTEVGAKSRCLQMSERSLPTGFVAHYVCPFASLLSIVAF